MSPISSFVGFALPISISLYICIESADTTSPLIFFASSIDKAVFPEAVGPHITITFGFIRFEDFFTINSSLFTSSYSPQTFY